MTWSLPIPAAPGRPLGDRVGLIWLGEERVQGDPRGPGGPPYSRDRGFCYSLS
jgi:hypothetical protein